MSPVGTHACVVCKKDKKRFSHLKFHRFPKDVSRCRKWLSSLKISCLREKTLHQLNASCVVCSEHFSEDQYLNGRLLPSAYPVTDYDGRGVHDGSKESTHNTSGMERDWFVEVTDQEEPDDDQVVTLPKYDVLTTGFGVIESRGSEEEFSPELADVVTTDFGAVDSNHSQEILMPKVEENNIQDTSNDSESMGSSNEEDQYLDLIRTILRLGNDEGEKISVKDKVVAMDLKTLIFIIGRRIVPLPPKERRDSGQVADSGSERLGTKHEEYQYLELVHKILHTGDEKSKQDRTGTTIISLFGAQMRFSLRDDVVPLLTTQQVPWQEVLQDFLSFVKGSRLLGGKDFRTWDSSSSQEYLDKSGFMEQEEEEDRSPVCGFRWSTFRAPDTSAKDNFYMSKGIDQLKKVIETIQKNPDDQQIMTPAWNPADTRSVALPHCLYQFYVANRELSCQVYQHYVDVGLAVPLTIASSALLIHMVAHITGLKPGELIYTLGEAHVNSAHRQALETQLKRTPRPFPVLRIKRKVGKIDDFVIDDFEICGYNPHVKIKLDTTV
ncbi:thymidylate synthase-like isoform X2 [Oratosquilla oratoria]|uniref:thymidylate synthase-like isoform X2 n=1 Tax=Oratosquilla oratoria TaxID=337810 RepID=UPI003F767FB8